MIIYILPCQPQTFSTTHPHQLKYHPACFPPWLVTFIFLPIFISVFPSFLSPVHLHRLKNLQANWPPQSCHPLWCWCCWCCFGCWGRGLPRVSPGPGFPLPQWLPLLWSPEGHHHHLLRPRSLQSVCTRNKPGINFEATFLMVCMDRYKYWDKICHNHHYNHYYIHYHHNHYCIIIPGAHHWCWSWVLFPPCPVQWGTSAFHASVPGVEKIKSHYYFYFYYKHSYHHYHSLLSYLALSVVRSKPFNESGELVSKVLDMFGV